jgi:hypothetical protein
MADNLQNPRSRKRSSLTAEAVALAVGLALVASLFYSQPVVRAYWWTAYAVLRMPLDAYQAGKR